MLYSALFGILTHSEGIDSRTHFLHIPLHWTELLIKWTATVPQHCRLQHVATAAVSLKQCRVQLHGQVWRETKESEEQRKNDNGASVNLWDTKI